MDNTWTDPLVNRDVRVMRTVELRDLPNPPDPVSLGQIIANLENMRVTVDGHDAKVFVLPAAGHGFPCLCIKAVKVSTIGTRAHVPLLKEFERLEEAARAELPVPRPYTLLGAKQGSSSITYLIMEGIDNAITLEGWLSREGSGIERKPHQKALLASQLGRLVARLHKAHFFHGELDPHSILLHDEPMGETAPDMWFVDIDQAEFIEKPSEEQVVANLARLGCWFVPRTTRADRMRFFKAFCQYAGYSGSLARRLMRHAERESLNLQFHMGSARIPRSLEQSSEMQALGQDEWRVSWRSRAGAMRWHMLESRLLRSEDEPHVVLKKFVQERVSPDRLQIIEVQLPPGAATNQRRREHAVASLWGLMNELYASSVPMGEPLAVYCGADNVTIFLRHTGIRLPIGTMLSSRQTRPSMRARLLRRLGRLVAAMHASGSYFAAIQPDDALGHVNVLMAYENPDPRPILSFATGVERDVPWQPSRSTESAALLLAGLGMEYSRVAAGHFLRGYLASAMPGRPHTELKEAGRLLIARAIRTARRSGKVPRRPFGRK